MMIHLLVVLALQDPLEDVVRDLEKDIAAVRGLEYRSPVVVRKVPRPPDVDKGIQGSYSARDKALVLYDDLRGPYARGMLVHEMAHALQDQHFGVDRVHSNDVSGDADLARAALIEGDATWTMIEVLKKERPEVAEMLDSPLAGAGNPRDAFLRAQGARYVDALKRRGGWKAVNGAYAHPPRTTAAVLHPEGVSTVLLGAGVSRGEFWILNHLASRPETAPLAVAAAAGWKGDLVVELGGSRAWVVVFATRTDALEFQEAMSRPRALEAEGAHGGARGVVARGERAFVLEAPDATAFKDLLDRMERGPRIRRVYSSREKRWITFEDMVDRLGKAALVCVGETHDSEPDHQAQLQILQALSALEGSLGVGMEMFQRPFQKAVDRYLAGELSEPEFLEAAGYRRRWGFDWSLYRPLVDFCREKGLPLAALNAPRELTSRISTVGYEGLSETEKADLGPVDFHVRAHRDYWFDRLALTHGTRALDAAQKERSYQVMTVWDDYMAESAARFQRTRGLRRLVVLAGSGHVDRGFGIPSRAAKRAGRDVVTVRVFTGSDETRASEDPPADFIAVSSFD